MISAYFATATFAIGTSLMMALGIVLYGSTVLLPLLMQEVLGYTATHAGITNLPRGLASFIAMPFVGYLTVESGRRENFWLSVLSPALIAMYDLSVLSLWPWLPRISGCPCWCRALAGIGVCSADHGDQRSDSARPHGQRHQHL